MTEERIKQIALEFIQAEERLIGSSARWRIFERNPLTKKEGSVTLNLFTNEFKDSMDIGDANSPQIDFFPLAADDEFGMVYVDNMGNGIEWEWDATGSDPEKMFVDFAEWINTTY